MYDFENSKSRSVLVKIQKSRLGKQNSYYLFAETVKRY